MLRMADETTYELDPDYQNGSNRLSPAEERLQVARDTLDVDSREEVTAKVQARPAPTLAEVQAAVEDDTPAVRGTLSVDSSAEVDAKIAPIATQAQGAAAKADEALEAAGEAGAIAGAASGAAAAAISNAQTAKGIAEGVANAQAAGRINFKTYAEMVADTSRPDGTIAEVGALESDESKRGTYQWDDAGNEWMKDSNDLAARTTEVEGKTNNILLGEYQIIVDGVAHTVAVLFTTGANGEKAPFAVTPGGRIFPDPGSSITTPGILNLQLLHEFSGDRIWAQQEGREPVELSVAFTSEDGTKVYFGQTVDGAQFPVPDPVVDPELEEKIDDALEQIDEAVTTVEAYASGLLSIDRMQRFAILQPSGFLFTNHECRIWWSSGRGYEVEFDYLAKKVIATPTYVDPVNGNDSNDGLTWETAKQSLGVLVDTWNPSASTPREVHLAPGWYDSSKIAASRDIQFPISLICDAGEAVFLCGQKPAWTKTSGQTEVWQATLGTSPGLFIDLSITDENGDYARPIKVASIAECDAASGSYYIAGNTIYVHTADNRAPDGEVWVTEARSNTRASNRFYAQGIKFLGGSYALKLEGTGDFCLVDFLVGYDTAGSGGLDVDRSEPYRGWAIRPGAAHSWQDGLNYHQGSGGTRCCDVVEIGGFYRGNGYNYALTSHNGSTTHEDGRIIRIECAAIGNQNRNFHDIDDCQVWMLGCVAGSPRNQANADDSVNFGVGSSTSSGATQAWYERCESLGGAVTDFAVYSNATLNVRATDTTSQKSNVTLGTLTSY